MTKKIAFIFPGQGSQSVGMLSALAESFPIVHETFATASAALGYDLWQLTQAGPADKLNQTMYTQPALLTASVAIWRVWSAQGGKQPVVMAGHSLGEYSALVCAGALDLATAVNLVAERGRFMQEAVPEGEGAMAAIVGLEDKQVHEICELAAQGEVVSPVNYNAIGQVVIAGKAQAIERAIQLAQQAGARLAMKLSVSAPSHCELMKPAAERLKAKLANISLKMPSISIINNVDVAINADTFAIKDALVRQLYSPVRWVETIQATAKQEIELFIECGPGKILAGLNKRIDTTLATTSINDLSSLQHALNL